MERVSLEMMIPNHERAHVHVKSSHPIQHPLEVDPLGVAIPALLMNSSHQSVPFWISHRPENGSLEAAVLEALLKVPIDKHVMYCGATVPQRGVSV